MACLRYRRGGEMKRIVLLLACLTSMLLSVQASELYRWVDAAGKVYYGDVPPAGAMHVEVKKFPEDIMSNEYQPYETRRAQQNFPVILYVGAGCGEACDQARSLLSKRGIPFSEKLLRTKQDVDAFKQLSGIDSFIPVLAVGKNFLKGFLESQWNSELDIAGYPKIAPNRPHKAPPPSAPGDTSQVAPVTLYVVANCIEYCIQARSLLAERGIPFSEKSLKTQEEIDAFKQLSGSNLSPTLEVGKSFLKGFQAEQWNNELDIAGYPKTAPYRAPSTPSIPAAASQVVPANPIAQ
jgi:glutaredoxin